MGWLINYEADDGKLGVKIISWDSIPTGVADSDYAANAYTAGEDYIAEFTSYTDGLYVRYVAVPEASTYAAILGAFALLFVFIRRRK